MTAEEYRERIAQCAQDHLDDLDATIKCQQEVTKEYEEHQLLGDGA